MKKTAAAATKEIVAATQEERQRCHPLLFPHVITFSPKVMIRPVVCHTFRMLLVFNKHCFVTILTCLISENRI